MIYFEFWGLVLDCISISHEAIAKLVDRDLYVLESSNEERVFFHIYGLMKDLNSVCEYIHHIWLPRESGHSSTRTAATTMSALICIRRKLT
jgi:hypothetical protein